jgi:hypothetical protein
MLRRMTGFDAVSATSPTRASAASRRCFRNTRRSTAIGTSVRTRRSSRASSVRRRDAAAHDRARPQRRAARWARPHLQHVWRDKAGLPQRAASAEASRAPGSTPASPTSTGRASSRRTRTPSSTPQLPMNIKRGHAGVRSRGRRLSSLMVDQRGVVSRRRRAEVAGVGEGRHDEGRLHRLDAKCGSRSSARHARRRADHRGRARPRQRARRQGAGRRRAGSERGSGVNVDESINSGLLAPWTTYNHGSNAPRPRMCSNVVQAHRQEGRGRGAEDARRGAPDRRPDGRRRFSRAQLQTDSTSTVPAGPEDTVEWKGSAKPETPSRRRRRAAPVLNRMGACPGCGAEFTLGEAEKKKRSQLSVK